MGMNRAEKEQEVEGLKAGLADCELVVITHNTGLTAKQSSDLRRKLRAEGAGFKVIKNTLARRALAGTKFEPLSVHLKGPAGIASSKDPIAAARIAYDFAKTNDKLVILGGMMGSEVMDAAAVKRIATLPSLDQLRGKIVGILQAPGAQLARLASAYAKKDEAAAAPAAE